MFSSLSRLLTSWYLIVATAIGFEVGAPSRAPSSDFTIRLTSSIKGLSLKAPPSSSITGYTMASSTGKAKKWLISADYAYFYKDEKLALFKEVKLTLYDSGGLETQIVSNEGLYDTNRESFKLYGDVRIKMSDGFVVSSEFLSYNPDHGLITAPTSNKVEGSGYVNGDLIEFDSFGFRYNSENKIMNLLSKSNVKSRADTDEWTIVKSDQCEMNNKTKILYFSMSPDSKNYVKTREPKLAVRSKVLELDLGSQNKINYMVATDDVLIRDLTKNDELSYDTCGKAEFKAESDIVRLTIFPQSYRNQDTVTADVILLHRDTDLVEAESTNGVTM